VAVVPEKRRFKLVIFSADKCEDISEREDGDAEEDPEEGGGFIGSIMYPFVNLRSAVVGRRSILNVREGSVDRWLILAVASTFPVNFDTSEDVESELELVRVVGVLKAKLDGLVGSWTFWESVDKGLS